MDELERAVSESLRRQAPSLETIRMLLRQQQSEVPLIGPVEVAEERLAAIQVEPANLGGYDELVGGLR